MRKIKFRAWDRKEKVMFNWAFAENGLVPSTFFNNSDYEVMQFTGLTDKNGKEIWEGDITKVFPLYKGQKNEFVVEWNRREAKWEGCWGEVIGNIYENPDLLK